MSILLKERVYQLRKEAHLSQQQLGDILGLTHKSISMIESGGRGTTIEKLVLLAGVFPGFHRLPAGHHRRPRLAGRTRGRNSRARALRVCGSALACLRYVAADERGVKSLWKHGGN